MQTNNWNAVLDMCQFGLKDPFTKEPYRHRKKLVHNSYALHLSLSELCPGKHEHAITQGTTEMKLSNNRWQTVDKTQFAR